MRVSLALLGLGLSAAAAANDMCNCHSSTPCQHLESGHCSSREFPLNAPSGGVCASDHFDCGVEKPVYPRKYKASFNVILPYINLVENAVTHVDLDRGLQRLSYYDDQDVFIYNATSSTSYEIVPVINDRTCFIAGGSAPGTVFPVLDKFQLKTTRQQVNNKLCHEWYLDQEEMGDENGYVGSYSLFVDMNGVPVSFSFHGHNVIAGGSHYDDYVVDYNDISEVDSFPESTWAPPPELTCKVLELDDDDGSTPGPKMDAVAPSPSSPLDDLHMLHPQGADARFDAFQGYAKLHDKHSEYAEAMLQKDDIARKQSNYHASMRYINAVNRQRLSYTLAPNHMADWSIAQRKRLNGRQSKPSSSPGALKIHKAPKGAAIPDHVDWRDFGAVSRVKDQGTCGSCWSYGTTGTIEGQHFLKYGKMVELSQQSLMDCSWPKGNHACDGGLDSQAYDWIVDGNKGGIPSAADYGQYMSMDGYCHVKPDMEMAHIRGYVNVTAGDWDSFNHALATVGPLSISINATPDSFYFYKGGLYDNKECNQDLDHTVLAVGYTTVNGKKYTIVKNSWSMAWGDEGYVQIAQDGDICGVSLEPTYALMQD